MTDTFSRRDIIRRAQGLVLASPFISLAACDGADARKPTVIRGTTMGTTYSVIIPRQPGGADARELERGISRVLETVNAQMSTYRADSELSRFNATASESPFPVSADTRRVVRNAIDIGRMTNGAFDPTIGPLVDLWGFGPPGMRRKAPSRLEIDDAVRRIGYRNVVALDTPPALRKDGSSVHIDLSGIAKGFGVDAVARLLERSGAGYYLVEIGGEVRARGYSPRGDAWRVGIERPDDSLRRRIVGLDGKGLATSGDYRIFFESEGIRYPHIIDPRSGVPVRHGLASVTVIARTTMRADALSTALMVMGPRAGLEFARENGIAAFFISKTKTGFVETPTEPFLHYLIAQT